MIGVEPLFARRTSFFRAERGARSSSLAEREYSTVVLVVIELN
jgi:hypothetical protein